MAKTNVRGGQIADGANGVDLTVDVTGTLPVANGGSGAATLTGILKGNGTSPFTVATSGTDYLAPSDLLASANTQTGTTYTFVLGDGGKVVEHNNASTGTYTVPPNSSVAYPTGTVIDLHWYGAGQMVIAAGAGVTINSPNSYLKLAVRFASATLRKRATDEWELEGDLSA